MGELMGGWANVEMDVDDVMISLVFSHLPRDQCSVSHVVLQSFCI